MKIERRTFRIGELAKQLSVQRFVIRFWEKEFNIAPRRSDGGQRYYTDQDLEKFGRIKMLLYDQRLTIEGAKKVLSTRQEDMLFKKVAHLKHQLIRLRVLL